MQWFLMVVVLCLLVGVIAGTRWQRRRRIDGNEKDTPS